MTYAQRMAAYAAEANTFTLYRRASRFFCTCSKFAMSNLLLLIIPKSFAEDLMGIAYDEE